MVIFLVSYKNDTGQEDAKQRLGLRSLGTFVEGLAVAERMDGKFVYYQRDYTLLNNEAYEEAHDFSNGFAAVKKDGKCYHITKPNGAPAYDQRYQWVLDFTVCSGLEQAGLLAQVKQLDNGRNKGETFKISMDGRRFYPA